MPPPTTKVARIGPEELGDKSRTPTNLHPHSVNVPQISEPTALSVQGSSAVESPTKMGGPDPLINVLQIRSTEQPSKRYNVNPSSIWEQAIPRCGTPFNHTVQVEKPSDRRIKPSLINIGYKDLSKRRITPKASRYTVAMDPHQYDRHQTHPCHGYAFGTTQPKFIG
jgi:hypothetical protein